MRALLQNIPQKKGEKKKGGTRCVDLMDFTAEMRWQTWVRPPPPLPVGQTSAGSGSLPAEKTGPSLWKKEEWSSCPSTPKKKSLRSLAGYIEHPQGGGKKGRSYPPSPRTCISSSEFLCTAQTYEVSLKSGTTVLEQQVFSNHFHGDGHYLVTGRTFRFQ